VRSLAFAGRRAFPWVFFPPRFYFVQGEKKILYFPMFLFFGMQFAFIIFRANCSTWHKILENIFSRKLIKSLVIYVVYNWLGKDADWQLLLDATGSHHLERLLAPRQKP
jgi:hypothetical protein